MAQSMIPYYQPSERLGLSIADLIMRRGDIAAQRAMNSGQIWGQAIGQLGQIASGAIQQHQERKSQEKREQALNTALESWDGKDLGTLYRSVAPVVGPEAGLKVTEGFGAILSSREKQQPDPEDFFKKVAGVRALKDKMGPEWMAKNWQGIAPVLATDAKAFLGVDLGGEFTPEYAQALDTLDDEYSAKKPQEAGFTLTPGAKRFDVSGKLVAEAPTGEKKYQVTVPGPGGPVTKLVSESEMAGGVREYQRPTEAAQPSFQTKEVLNDEGKPTMANFNARSGQYVEVATGKPIKNPRPVPSAAETQDTRKFKQAAPILSAVSELSEKINTLQGVAAKASGEVEKAKAKVNLNDNVAEYEALISGFTPLVARALGHTGVLTQQDVDSVKALFPRPGDSKSLRDRKVARIKGIIGQLEGGGEGAPAGGSVPKVGERRSFNGKIGQWDGKGWVEVR